MKHDYLRALAWFEERSEYAVKHPQQCPHKDAIRNALKLAAVVTGEIDTPTAIEGLKAFENSFGTPVTRQIESFKAMIAQAEKGIG